MDFNDRLQKLLRLTFAEFKEMPENSTQDVVDDEGQICQSVSWREQIGPDSCRIVVSCHP